MSDLIKYQDYRNWIVSIKDRTHASQKVAKWGDGFWPQMSLDLLAEFPEIKGLSLRNLEYRRQWVRFWADSPAIGQHAVAQGSS